MVAAQVRTKVRVVTDSTACLPFGVAEQLGISVVPLQVHLGERSGWEGVDISPADVTHALTSKVAVSTSPPTPQAFTSAFTAASALGREANPYDVVAVLMSGSLSETVEHARQGAHPLDFAGVQVEVVDARATAMALGFAVLAAARAANEGHTAKMVARCAEDALRNTEAIFYVDSLEQLRRSGRIGPGSAFFGTALSVKPLLHLKDGQIEQWEKVRGESKALTRLVDRLYELSGEGKVEVAVHHLAAPERAAYLRAELMTKLGGRVHSVSVTELGAVLGAHIGPGMAGAAIHRI